MFVCLLAAPELCGDLLITAWDVHIDGFLNVRYGGITIHGSQVLFTLSVTRSTHAHKLLLLCLAVFSSPLRRCINSLHLGNQIV